MKMTFLLAVILFAAQSSLAQWEPELRLTWDPSSSQTAICSSVHAIASSGDSIHVVWYDSRDGNNEIYYMQSVDGGLTWGEEIRLTNSSSASRWPTVAVSGTVVHVAWVEGYSAASEVYYKRSIDGGITWGNSSQLTFTPSYTWHPCISVSGADVHMVYYDYCDDLWEAYYKHSADGGLNWQPDVRLTNDPAFSIWPAISASGPVLHVTWYDSRDGNTEIYYKRSIDNGISWGADTRLTNNDSTSWNASLGVSGLNVYVVWEDKRDGNSELYFKRSTDGGLNWDQDYRLTNNLGASKFPNLVSSGEGLFVVWVDDTNLNKEIYFKRSADGGLNWSQDIRLTNDPSESGNPFISASNSKLHVVWWDARDGNNEIYYKRDPTGNLITGSKEGTISNSGDLISISPNPASTSILINYNAKSDEKTLVSIRNLLGEELLLKRIQNGEMNIDVSGLPNGIYCVFITTNDKAQDMAKLIISK